MAATLRRCLYCGSAPLETERPRERHIECPACHGAMSEIEAEHRAKLAEIKHRTYMDKREGQLARMAVRIDLLHHRAENLAPATKANLAAKYATFQSEVDEVKAKAGVTSKEHRDAATAAWKELRAAFNAAYEEAGLGGKKYGRARICSIISGAVAFRTAASSLTESLLPLTRRLAWYSG